MYFCSQSVGKVNTTDKSRVGAIYLRREAIDFRALLPSKLCLLRRHKRLKGRLSSFWQQKMYFCSF